ncbi:hypothetical protein [Paraburkholderia sp. BL23I1N1]|uniref:hypothetical protein n=1 Tax=Paraburkholderia sp. BL23I1N1 TaxID=1938802 RepID=UPI0011C46168|nr:hypothetical protein [Paraburkholderia sp. BL23I1N1]
MRDDSPIEVVKDENQQQPLPLVRKFRRRGEPPVTVYEMPDDERKAYLRLFNFPLSGGSKLSDSGDE